MKIKNNQSGATHLIAILLVVLIVTIGMVAWKVWEKKANDTSARSNKATTQKNTGKDTDTTKIKENVDKTVAAKAAILKALDSHDYESLAVFMEDSVAFARQSSDTTNANASKAQAISELSTVFEPSAASLGAKTPWDFSVMSTDTTFAANIKKTNNAAFENAFIGRSADKNMFVAFKFGDEGLISSFWDGISIYNY